MDSKIDRLFIIVGLLFAGAGLVLGEEMGRSGNHAQMPTHTHIMLAGWVFPVLYGLIYRAFPAIKKGVLPYVHFALHFIGASALTAGLAYVFNGHEAAGPVVIFLAGGSWLVILGWLIFAFLFVTRGGKGAGAA